MASGMEPVPVTSQKHDPAWKHCQMYKIGDRVQLKCIYCGKIFKGGGIHRIKEHLACQKGNAATCLRVPADVRLQMLESLNGIAVKKRKKQKLAEEMSGSYDNPETSGVDVLNNNCGINTEVELLPVPEMHEQNADMLLNREDSYNKMGGRKKKGRVRKAPAEANLNALVSSNIQPTNSKKVNNPVHMAIGRFFYDVGITLDAVNSAYFRPMIDAIASQGEGVIGPSYHDLRNWILKNSVQEVRNDVHHFTSAWNRTGCSLLVDEWNSESSKRFLNFLVYCPEGTIFLRSVDISHVIDSTDGLYELLKETVEEVGVRNVMQVVTSGEERYVIAGKRLMDTYPSIFWMPCAGHCIDLVLEDIKELDWVKVKLEQAKFISRYIYTNSIVLNMMRRYTFGADMVHIGKTRSATDFMTLKRMMNIRHNLQSMVTSEEWMESPLSKKPEALAVLDCISDQSFWDTCVSIVSLTDPLLRLLKIVGSLKRPGMGFIYAGLYRVKETVKKEFVDKKKYSTYWNIIDRRWEQLHRHPLHAAGFYFNPKFFYSLDGDMHLLIRSLVYDCIEKLESDPKIQDKIVKETASYHSGTGDFGRKMAIRARDTLLPTEWWSTYGGGCPNLARLAIRILSQTCSLIKHNPTEIPLERLHEKKNCLEHQRLNDLVFVQYNMSLRQMMLNDKELETVDPISYENISIVEDWIVDKELLSEGAENSDWMSVDPPLGNSVLLGPPIDDVEALGGGFDDYEIFDGVKVEEDDDENMAS